MLTILLCTCLLRNLPVLCAVLQLVCKHVQSDHSGLTPYCCTSSVCLLWGLVGTGKHLVQCPRLSQKLPLQNTNAYAVEWIMDALKGMLSELSHP
jgi:hypothetical protein